MGRLETQENLFYLFRIEDFVPQDHLLRRIDWLLDFDAIRGELVKQGPGASPGCRLSGKTG